MTRRCPARCWTFQGLDSLQCDLNVRHEARHLAAGRWGIKNYFDSDEVGAKGASFMKHFFNVLMWVILMALPVTILILTDGLARLVETMYWPYRRWVERTFPTRRP